MKNILDNVLNEYNLSTPINIEQLSSYANKVFLISYPSRQFILKEYSSIPKEQVVKITNARNILQTHNFPIPNIIANKDGKQFTEIDEHIYDLSEYIAHVRYEPQNVPLPFLKKAGNLLATLHTISFPENEIDSMGFPSLHVKVKDLCKKFAENYENIFHDADVETKERLQLLLDFIKKTEKKREEIFQNDSFYTFQKQSPIPTHGDFSLHNLLDTKNNLYLVDWDNIMLRPQAFEIQRSLGVLCGKGRCNGNLDEIDRKKAQAFLDGYQEIFPLTKAIVHQMAEVAEYCMYVYWLEFTLQQIINNDFRVLTLLPKTLNQALYWGKNIEEYKEFLLEIASLCSQ